MPVPVQRALLILVLTGLAPAQGYTLVSNLVYGTYKDASSTTRNLLLDLYKPIGATAPTPVVVWIHGGAWSGGSKWPCPQEALQLVARGYAVASIDYRFSFVARWPAQIQDCKGAIRFLRKQAAAHNLDRQRIGVFGASAGGHLAALLGNLGGVASASVGNVTVDLEGSIGGNLDQPSRVQAVCNWFGPTHALVLSQFPSIDHDDPASPESELLGGPLQQVPERWATADPVTFLGPDDPPTLIQHGTLDPTVPFAASEMFYEAANLDAGSDASFVPVQGGGHGGAPFTSTGNLALVAAFFDRCLKNLPAVTVDVVATDPSASESGDPGLFTLTRTGTLAAPLQVRIHAPGDAALPLGTLVTIPAGQAAITLPVLARQDALVEGAQPVTLTICPAPTYRVAVDAASATVVVDDDEDLSDATLVTIRAADAQAAEALLDPGSLLVTRSGSVSGPLRVHYQVRGSALPGEDFAPLPGTLTIPANAASAPLVVLPVDDSRLEPGEYVEIVLLPGTDYGLGTTTRASVVIADDDRTPGKPIVSVAATAASAREDGSAAGTFLLTRTGATTSPLAVHFALLGTARPGLDATVTPASPVTIPAGAAGIEIQVRGLQDALIEGDESLVLAVQPGAAYLLGARAAREVVLVDDDAPPLDPGLLQLAVAPLARDGLLVASLAGGAPADSFVVWIAAAGGFLPLGALGVLQLDLLAMAALGAGTFDAQGGATVAVRIPDLSQFAGGVAHFQALRVGSLIALSNALVRRVQ